MRIDYYPQPPDNERRNMDAETAQRIMEAMETRWLADPRALNDIIPSLAIPDRLDGWTTTKYLTDALGDAYDLYWADLGLQRHCFGNEHAAAVMDGSEIDYAPLFYDAPYILQINRMVNLLQDSGKVLSVALQGDNFAQSFYNRLVTRNVLGSIDDNNLSPMAKKAVMMLVDQGIIGGILQNRDVSEEMAEFQAEWPPELAEFRDDLLLATYLSDASAHSAHRLIRNPRNGHIEPAVRPDDPQLTFLFQRHRNGAVTVTPDRCEMLQSALPGVSRLRHLLVNEVSPYPREDDVFTEVVAQKLARHAVDESGIRLLEPHEYGQDVIFLKSNPLEGSHVHRITQYSRGDRARQRSYFLPGDGRIWLRAADVSSIHPHFFLDYPLSPEQYQHPDAEVAAMQKNILETTIYSQKENVGLPLTPQEAWHVINDTENHI